MMISPLKHRSLSFRAHGPHEAPALVMLHGFLGDGDDFDSVTATLSKKWRVVTVDLPGHGSSPILDVHGAAAFEHCAELLLDVVDQLATPWCHLLGYSMGGRIALYTAVKFPARFRSLILESSSPGLSSPEEQAERRQQDEATARRLESQPLETFLADWYRQPLFGRVSEDADRLGQLIDKRRHGNVRHLAWALRALGTGCQLSLWETLSRVSLPVLLITGQNDSKFTKIAASMRVLLPDARGETLSGAGHNVHMELPDDYAAVVSSFLKECDKS